jgi:sugar/nucleoside kinase (ribokinase family)
MKRQVLLLGGCCIDEILECDYLPSSGDDILIKSKKVMLGGSCLNVATVLKRLGKDPVLYSALDPNVYAQYILDLKDEGFDCSCLYEEQGQTGTCTILIDKTKERTFLTYNGIEGNFDENRIPQEIINEIDWIYLSGIFLTYKDESQKIVPFLLRMVHQGKHIIFDLGSLINQIEITLLKECVELSSIIKGNEYEINCLVRRLSIPHITNIIKDNLRVIIKTCGSEGSITYVENNILSIPSIEVEPIDTTGSGDSFVGAFISSLLDNLTTQECLEIASKFGALATRHPGGRIKLNEKKDKA